MINNINYLSVTMSKYIKAYIGLRCLIVIVRTIIIFILYIYFNADIHLCQPLDKVDLGSEFTTENHVREIKPKSVSTVNELRIRVFNNLTKGVLSNEVSVSDFQYKDQYITNAKEEFKEFYTTYRKSIKLSN